MRKALVIILLFNCSISVGQNSLNLVPIPAENNRIIKGPAFKMNSSTVIYYNSTLLEKDVAYFKTQLKSQYGLSIQSKHSTKIKSSPTGNNIFINLGPKGWESGKGEEYYSIYAVANNLSIVVQHPKGFFYCIQTILQSIKKTASTELEIPAMSFSDYPRFPYRGIHFDVCRHFFPVSFIKKYIDYLAAYKFNTFHWHLTDDQGWRIQIKKYPELTTIGAQRNGTLIGRYPGKGNDNIPYGGFYTQQEIKEVIQYAKDRYIEVIPEIEMPGHSSAAIAAYPWMSCFPQKPTEMPPNMMSQKSMDEQKAGRIKLVQETWGVFDDVFCAGKDSTFQFLENVLDEVSALFPSKYIHIGGDESPKTHWKICPACQKRMKDNNLKDEHELQSYFIQRIEKYLNSKGKTIIGWDEILEGGLAPNAVVMSWRGEAGGIEAAKQKHNVIMTPGNPLYFDHTQSKNEDSVTFGGYNPIENVYAYEPVAIELDAEQGKYILGAQANLWTEYVGYSSKVEYQLFPRITALSEVLWSPKEKRDWKDFERRLPVIFERLDKQKINYSNAYYDLKATVLPTENFDGVAWKLESKINCEYKRIAVTEYFKEEKDQRFAIIKYDSLGYVIDSTIVIEKRKDISTPYDNPVKISSDDSVIARLICHHNELNSISQKFFFNKATGKKITLTTEADKKYPGDGAFTLVNGVQNEKGMAKSSEFLGFNGTDMEATIDLGILTDISKITVHVLDQNGSWIYLPSQIKITYMPDVDYTDELVKAAPKEIRKVDPIAHKGAKTITIESKQKARYLHVLVKNYGIIPSGNAGAGNPAWLFVDEIEVQ